MLFRSDKVANAIYFASESIHLKKKIIRGILTANKDEQETEIVNSISKAVTKAHNQRNVLAHACIQIHEGKILSLNARHNKEIGQFISSKYLEQLHEHSSIALLDAQNQFGLLCQKREIRPKVSHI